MEVSRPKENAIWGDERGFTLPEVLITIVLMGIVFGIATVSWFGVVESRAVDSATNQFAADLRLAHSSATNQLRNWQVVVPSAESQTYTIGPVGVPAEIKTRTLDDAEVDVAVTVTFSSDGKATQSPSGTIRVRASDNNPGHDIQLTPATSRVKID